MIIDFKKKKIELKNISEFEPIQLEEIKDTDKKVIFCSIVSTSLNPSYGDLLRINLKLCYFSKEGKLSKVRKTISFFNDPKRELEQEESKFLDFDLKDKVGSTIDWKLISNLFNGSDLIVSHNSSFVKPWIEKYIGSSENLWSCSLEHVNWSSSGFPSRNLQTLSVFSGLFYDFKDSAAALDALIYVLSLNDKASEMLERADKPDLQIFAANSPRGSNQALKDRRYRWNPEVGSWWLSIEDKEQGKIEESWLLENLPGVEPQIFEIDPKFRFSK